MITASDSFNTVARGQYYAILPSSASYSIDEYCQQFVATRVPAGFSYNSGENPDFLTVEQLRALIEQHVTNHAVD